MQNLHFEHSSISSDLNLTPHSDNLLQAAQAVSTFTPHSADAYVMFGI